MSKISIHDVTGIFIGEVVEVNETSWRQINIYHEDTVTVLTLFPKDSAKEIHLTQDNYSKFDLENLKEKIQGVLDEVSCN